MRNFHDIRTVRDIKGSGSCAHLTGVWRICARRQNRVEHTEITDCEPAKKVQISAKAPLDEPVRQLTAANKELEAFTYSVSHDLRAPLRAIDGFAALLLHKLADEADLDSRHYLERIRTGTAQMNERIDGLLSLSRLAQSELRRERVDLSNLAQSIADDLHKREPHRAVEFVVTPRMVVEADVHLVRVLLDNLFENAWKYTSKHLAARIEMGTTERDGQTVFLVRDDGAGFDMTYANKLFTPFQRLHSATEFEGNGIGLATVQRIVQRHGGQIWAEGALDRGATFYFTLGACSVLSATCAGIASAGAANGRPCADAS